MFFLTYMLSELRRRSGRTLLTALGLGLGVGLVVTVNALSTGLDRAQARILEPLTGVGTDMSVSRPIEFSPQDGGGGFPQLSEEEREQLMEENGGMRLGLRGLGEPGEAFSRDTFVSTAQLSFDAGEVTRIRSIDGVASAAGGLTLNAVHIEGTVPEQTEQPQFGQPGGGGGPPENIDVSTISVAGVDPSVQEIGAITPGQLTSGRYFGGGNTREAIVNESYAARESIAVGDEVSLGGKTFTVVGVAETPLGGQSSDVYVKLAQLQALSDRAGRINTVYVRADDAGDVAAVATSIEDTVDGASVTTAEDLADRVSGTLVDAKNLAGSLGTALMIVGLLAAFLIASLLTLSSVTKRVREFGTLKALGWSQRLVVRQVTGESLFQGLLGGAIGIVVGIVGALAIGAFGPTLEASVAASEEGGGSAGGLRFAGPFGQGAIESTITEVALDAPVSGSLAVWAVALAVLGGLVAGAVGSLRASRLRPADALRHID